MKKVTVLNNDMFDDGSIDCLNFWLADQEGTRMVDASFIRKCGLVGQVNKARKSGKSYIETKGLVYGGLEIFEIQWG